MPGQRHEKRRLDFIEKPVNPTRLRNILQMRLAARCT